MGKKNKKSKRDRVAVEEQPAEEPEQQLDDNEQPLEETEQVEETDQVEVPQDEAEYEEPPADDEPVVDEADENLTAEDAEPKEVEEQEPAEEPEEGRLEEQLEELEPEADEFATAAEEMDQQEEEEEEEEEARADEPVPIIPDEQEEEMDAEMKEAPAKEKNGKHHQKKFNKSASYNGNATDGRTEFRAGSNRQREHTSDLSFNGQGSRVNKKHTFTRIAVDPMRRYHQPEERESWGPNVKGKKFRKEKGKKKRCPNAGQRIDGEVRSHRFN